LEKAIEIKRRAQRFVQGGDVDAALEEYEKLARAEENEPYHSVVIADLLFKKGDSAGAAHRYLIAIDGYELAGLYKNGIAVCKKMARLGLAPSQVFRRLGHLHQRDGLTTESALYYVQHAEYALRAGDPREAAKSFRLAFECGKENVQALERLAELHLSSGEQEEAVAALKEAIENHERLGQIADANRCRSRLGQLGSHAAHGRPAPPPVPAAAESIAGEGPLKATRSLEVAGNDLGGPKSKTSGPPRLQVPGARAPALAAGGAGVAAGPGVAPPALESIVMLNPLADARASDAGSGLGVAEPLSSSDAEADGLEAAIEGISEYAFGAPASSTGGTALGEEPDPADRPRAERPGLRFDGASGQSDAEAGGLFWSLAQDAVNVPEIQALVEQAHEQYCAGARDAAVQMLVRVAQAYDAASDLEGAARVYRALRAYLPPVRPALMLWIDNCRRRGDREEASRVAVDLGEEALARGDASPAREWFERALALDPSSAAATARLGDLGPGPAPRPAAAGRPSGAPRTAAAPSAQASPQPARGVEFAAAAATEEPGKIEVKHGQGDEVNIELGELLETFRREVQQQVSGDAHSHYALGVSYLEMGLVDQAIESLRAAAEDPSLKVTASELIGRCLMDHGRFEEAATEFRNVLDEPSLAGESALNLRFELGLALEAAGRLDDALAQFERVYSSQPSYPDAAMKIRALRRTLEHE